jgi:hypothetical protein
MNKQLLYGALGALPFIGVRQLYGIIIFLDDIKDKQDSKFATSKPLKYLMSAIPELVAICIFCFVGIKTRHISKLVKGSKYTVVEGVGSSYQGPNDDRVPLQHISQQEGIYEPYKNQYPSQNVGQQYPSQTVQQQPAY